MLRSRAVKKQTMWHNLFIALKEPKPNKNVDQIIIVFGTFWCKYILIIAWSKSKSNQTIDWTIGNQLKINHIAVKTLLRQFISYLSWILRTLNRGRGLAIRKICRNKKVSQSFIKCDKR